jgi:hypothetical protein
VEAGDEYEQDKTEKNTRSKRHVVNALVLALATCLVETQCGEVNVVTAILLQASTVHHLFQPTLYALLLAACLTRPWPVEQ